MTIHVAPVDEQVALDQEAGPRGRRTATGGATRSEERHWRSLRLHRVVGARRGRAAATPTR